MTNRIAKVGLERDFSTDHYLPGHNAFEMARLQVGAPVLTPVQQRARIKQDRANAAQRARRGAALKTPTQTILRVNKYDPICETTGLFAQANEIRAERRKAKTRNSAN